MLSNLLRIPAYIILYESHSRSFQSSQSKVQTYSLLVVVLAIGPPSIPGLSIGSNDLRLSVNVEQPSLSSYYVLYREILAQPKILPDN